MKKEGDSLQIIAVLFFVFTIHGPLKSLQTLRIRKLICARKQALQACSSESLYSQVLTERSKLTWEILIYKVQWFFVCANSVNFRTRFKVSCTKWSTIQVFFLKRLVFSENLEPYKTWSHMKKKHGLFKSFTSHLGTKYI